jgi:hypothetical protein
VPWWFFPFGFAREVSEKQKTGAVKLRLLNLVTASSGCVDQAADWTACGDGFEDGNGIADTHCKASSTIRSLRTVMETPSSRALK